MRDVTSAALYLQLGARMRKPAGVPVGRLRRVTISNVVATDVDPRYASIVSGIPGHPIEDVTLSGIRILYRGAGGSHRAGLGRASATESADGPPGVARREPLG